MAFAGAVCYLAVGHISVLIKSRDATEKKKGFSSAFLICSPQVEMNVKEEYNVSVFLTLNFVTVDQNAPMQSSEVPSIH